MSVCLWCAVLLFVAWLGSGWWFISWIGASGWSAGIGRGGFGFGRVVVPREFAVSPGWVVGPDYPPARSGYAPIWEWTVHWASPHPPNFYTSTPLWIPFVTAAMLAAFLYRRHRREHRRTEAGLCPTCGYDRRGLASPAAPCPECGSPSK
ncbi:hypothetical protein PHYC_00924 [Phycisphaerales bacterium]|nr:hypothetical protein PHYC_00924 [Phycisphaerales bacterium]